jgi:hypothetical protein
MGAQTRLTAAVCRAQDTKKADARVGIWDWWHVEEWEVGPNSFTLRTVPIEMFGGARGLPSSAVGNVWEQAAGGPGFNNAVGGQTHFAFATNKDDALKIHRKCTAIVDELLSAARRSAEARGGAAAERAFFDRPSPGSSLLSDDGTPAQPRVTLLVALLWLPLPLVRRSRALAYTQAPAHRRPWRLVTSPRHPKQLSPSGSARTAGSPRPRSRVSAGARHHPGQVHSLIVRPGGQRSPSSSCSLAAAAAAAVAAVLLHQRQQWPARRQHRHTSCSSRGSSSSSSSSSSSHRCHSSNSSSCGSSNRHHRCVSHHSRSCHRSRSNSSNGNSNGSSSNIPPDQHRRQNQRQHRPRPRAPPLTRGSISSGRLRRRRRSSPPPPLLPPPLRRRCFSQRS